MSFSLVPHELVRDPRSGAEVVRHRSDYVMLSNAGERVYVQQGNIYAGNWDRPAALSEVPDWFWDAFRRLTPESRKSCGLELPEDQVQTVAEIPADVVALLKSLPESLRLQLLAGATMPTEAPRIDEKALKISDEGSDMGAFLNALKNHPEAPKPKTWTCDDCGDTVSTIRKGVHIAAHRRAEKAALKGVR